jgi:predicted nucleotidyltransferase
MTAAITPDEETLHTARLFLERIRRRYEMTRAILFGSRARQTHRPDSDADIAIVLRGESGRFLPTKLDMADIAFDVMLETGVRVQPLPVWEGEWAHPERHPNPRLIENIASEGIPL